MTIQSLPLVITSGEPAGIGMDIILMLADKQQLNLPNRAVIVLADINALQQRYSELKQKGAVKHGLLIQQLAMDELKDLPQIVQPSSDNIILVVDVPTAQPVVAGQLNPHNAPMVIAQLQLAHKLAISKQVAAIVTAPLQKSVIMTVLPDFMGHTEFFMQQSGLDKVVMMLANNLMKVALVTTHLPLRAVADAISHEEVAKTVDIVIHDCQQKFGLTHPKILVCGLNPHAGESGYLGREEIDIINPVLQHYRDQGVDISLAMPADTLFTQKHIATADAIIAMYHDQGLAPLKSHGFGETVNITLGLPYIRTSVDHGTALDLAGTGKASADSLYHAIDYANNMATAIAL
ncbi:4-hydroxythreonine-4-phosphate dehydrogenase PdxA [Moraxella osloensis]|uniref:4-hydroxythreonine-4-phosphate dehydrogenase PdxA n=1 Tax=Faucicola osloensis TaxID=34062 RepID=UPI002432B2BB|nr:4-hydroxythreonine-4-phosphate dehydrogenase PdxA [Moraxella osloensis]